MGGHHAGESRQRILQEALRLMLEHGYQGLSMRELAEGAGISKAGIYHHFADKEALFIAILEQTLLDLEALIVAAEAEGGTTQDKLTRVVRVILQQTPAQRSIIRLANQEIGHLSGPARQTFNQAYHRQFIGRLTALLQQGIKAGEFRPLNPTILTWALLGLLYPYLDAGHLNQPETSEEIIRHLVTIFFTGIAVY